MRSTRSTSTVSRARPVARLVAGEPYTGLQDVWLRARPSLPLAQRLIRIGAFDALSPGLTRRDLLLQAVELHRQSRNRIAADGQLPPGGELVTASPSGQPDMTSPDKLGAELDTLSIDVSRHLMEHHRRLLQELGATTQAHLRAMVPGQKVLVAGLQASAQTRRSRPSSAPSSTPWRTAPARSASPSSRTPTSTSRTPCSAPGCRWRAAPSRRAARACD